MIERGRERPGEGELSLSGFAVYDVLLTASSSSPRRRSPRKTKLAQQMTESEVPQNPFDTPENSELSIVVKEEKLKSRDQRYGFPPI